jgi:hypothetical protein
MVELVEAEGRHLSSVAHARFEVTIAGVGQPPCIH